MKNFRDIRQMIAEAKGLDVTIEVKGFKGNMKKFEDFAEEDGVVGMMIGFFDVPEPASLKYTGNKIVMGYDEEDLEDEGTSIKQVFKDIRSFCFEQSRASKATSKVVTNFLKKGGPKDDIEDVLDDADMAMPVDAIFRTAALNGYGDFSKPFVYRATLK